jgi:hypothetical protein
MIGVCIKYFHENYGGMLQAYATASMLEARGLEYELIQYEKVRSIPGMVRSMPRLLNRVLLNDKYEAFLKKQGMKAHPEFAEMDKVRMQCFKTFKDTHFTKLSPVFRGYEALCKGARRYAAVVTGSDQLWSPAGLPTNYYNLMFVPEDVRKISYASSFGVSYIPWYQKGRTAQYLNRIEFVSMRENKGAQLVKELTGRDVPTILDPVFMFDRAGWEKLIPTEKIVEEPYILAYFLGANPEHRKAVKQAAKELGCKIVTLPHMDQYVAADEDFGDYRLYEVGPDKFLNLIRGAKYVCTDSFHGSCFAIIHHIPFVTFSRYDENSGHSKNSRIDTLCGNLKLENRRFSTVEELGSRLAAPINWEQVAQNLAALKEKTDDYLERAFDGIK